MLQQIPHDPPPQKRLCQNPVWLQTPDGISITTLLTSKTNYTTPYLWRILNERKISCPCQQWHLYLLLACLLPTPLADTYPHFFSVSISISPSVLPSHVMQNGLLATLWNHLTSVASVEFASVLSLLQDVTTSNAPGDRFLTQDSWFT